MKHADNLREKEYYRNKIIELAGKSIMLKS